MLRYPPRGCTSGSGGYSALPDVIGRAGVSRTTFDEQFEDKAGLPLATYEQGTELRLALLGLHDEAARAAPTP